MVKEILKVTELCAKYNPMLTEKKQSSKEYRQAKAEVQ